jgi:hypothetical protein
VTYVVFEDDLSQTLDDLFGVFLMRIPHTALVAGLRPRARPALSGFCRNSLPHDTRELPSGKLYRARRSRWKSAGTAHLHHNFLRFSYKAGECHSLGDDVQVHVLKGHVDLPSFMEL